ncbi:class V aminotransferase [Anopheles sinensis]|uniref:Class V aminotransferase n=1 Tax=Anopheles sinensis TaxID=74873 RepID=A0A084W470_ANOSI|nr:class V aminotransferase [Anopheles sinensis]
MEPLPIARCDIDDGYEFSRSSRTSGKRLSLPEAWRYVSESHWRALVIVWEDRFEIGKYAALTALVLLRSAGRGQVPPPVDLECLIAESRPSNLLLSHREVGRGKMVR